MDSFAIIAQLLCRLCVYFRHQMNHLSEGKGVCTIYIDCCFNRTYDFFNRQTMKTDMGFRFVQPNTYLYRIYVC